MAVKHLNKDDFDGEIKEGITLVDFWAPWCGPCQILGPIFEELSDDENLKDKVTFAKLNTDEDGEIAMNYGVQGIPTMILFKDGEPVGREVGAIPKANIVEFINKHTS